MERNSNLDSLRAEIDDIFTSDDSITQVRQIKRMTAGISEYMQAALDKAYFEAWAQYGQARAARMLGVKNDTVRLHALRHAERFGVPKPDGATWRPRIDSFDLTHFVDRGGAGQAT